MCILNRHFFMYFITCQLFCNKTQTLCGQIIYLNYTFISDCNNAIFIQCKLTTLQKTHSIPLPVNCFNFQSIVRNTTPVLSAGNVFNCFPLFKAPFRPSSKQINDYKGHVTLCGQVIHDADHLAEENVVFHVIFVCFCEKCWQRIDYY